mmetsp:Transcript_6705/g.9774  ORF Transcript_6705/g.9774 Transcript_6705/m.9774 type:complete len:89 (-) Transcript_6705:424-690(-)
MSTSSTTLQMKWGKIQKLVLPLSSKSSPTPLLFEILQVFMKDDGTYFNNEHYPTLIYKNAFHGSETDGRQLLLLNKNDREELCSSSVE